MGPWKPIVKNEKLYGRDGADDSYALFDSICSIKSLQKQQVPLPRISILIEFSEESGSSDLPHHMNICKSKIRIRDLVICLVSGTGDYKRLWTTTSLPILIGLKLRVNVLKEGVHSGGASGYIPSSFRISRQLLSRIENQETGEILLDELKVKIPGFRTEETKKHVQVIGKELRKEFPWISNMRPSTNNDVKGVLRRTWMPALSIVGGGGLSQSEKAGNVLRPYTELQLSVRIPPFINQKKAQNAIKKVLLKNPPYNSKTSLVFDEPASAGWSAPKTSSWLEKTMNEGSLAFFKKPYCFIGEGGTISFMAMLSNQFPDAQFLITGVLRPDSNAHKPNKFLHVPYAKKLTACDSYVLSKFSS